MPKSRIGMEWKQGILGRGGRAGGYGREGGIKVGLLTVNNRDDTYAIRGIVRRIEGVANAPKLMAMRPRIPSPSPAPSYRTSGSRAPPSSPTDPNLVYPPFFWRGNMNLRSVYFLDTMAIVYLYPIPTPAFSHLCHLPTAMQRSPHHRHQCFSLHEASWVISMPTACHARPHHILFAFCTLYYI
ncbi:uncharacterized protein EV420DRAFT_1666781 [Desarmillaria tabescens]|uniref:Uncharacterized protein n=1 Tax=Armillaria tabescens TaxID=1929756 RepID=A0AA39JAP8_ARMTA|nr:uncharacterized protein EV420DRAFT_1666781 [Desarmillaria tabescens]KAK0437904.1 hypothetical protein EV420DRAFT_1666781 [Desarmillaria tabescens]